MGAAADIFAFGMADIVRTTLETFLADHPDLEHREVEVAEHADILHPSGGSFGITIDGAVLEVRVCPPHAENTDGAVYVARAIASFDADPADSDFQRGYLAALKDVQREAFHSASEDRA